LEGLKKLGVKKKKKKRGRGGGPWPSQNWDYQKKETGPEIMEGKCSRNAFNLNDLFNRGDWPGKRKKKGGQTD